MTSLDPTVPDPPSILLDHLTVAVTDLAASRTFYDAALAPLGVRRIVDYLDPEDEDEVGPDAVGYGGPDLRVVLWLVVTDEVTRGLHLALRAADEAGVRAFYDAAVAHGGTARTPPRAWQLYRAGRFSATVSDPNGNRVEAVFESDQSTSS